MAVLLAQGGFLMMHRHFSSSNLRWLCSAFLCALFCTASLCHGQYTGPAPTKSDSPNPENKGLMLRAPSEMQPGEPLVLHPGDLIDVSVYGVSDYKIKARIVGDGQVDLPLVGAVRLGGLTVEQAQKLVAQKLVSGQLILYPDVLISVEDSSVDIIGVMGEVNSPKAIPAFAPMSLLDAISAAGGLKPDASHSISILRKGSSQPLLVVLNSNPVNALSQNVPLYPGDRVIVPRTGVVYVVGAILHSGAFGISPDTPMTLMQAVTLGGGAGYQASMGDTRIIRTTGATRREIPVNLGKILKGTAPDPVLQSDDIVFIPTNAMKAAIKSGGIGIAIGLLYLIPLIP